MATNYRAPRGVGKHIIQPERLRDFWMDRIFNTSYCLDNEIRSIEFVSDEEYATLQRKRLERREANEPEQAEAPRIII